MLLPWLVMSAIVGATVVFYCKLARVRHEVPTLCVYSHYSCAVEDPGGRATPPLPR